jgi:ectoine hydroxylase-related dioxygenase (phytanoyl-CoA dioxygenase family)
MIDDLQRCGYALAAPILDPEDLEVARGEANRVAAAASGRGGVRSVLRRSQYFKGLAEGVLADLARTAIGPSAAPVKATLFDKTGAANWKVPWHQDLTISVRQRREVSGFGPWSVKDGVVHVQPPASVLESLVALRLHLDDTPADNGALRVMPGTHLLGRIGDERRAALVSAGPELVCVARAGEVLFMKPLLLHASAPSHFPGHRRVLHVEYASQPLPGDLEWAA